MLKKIFHHLVQFAKKRKLLSLAIALAIIIIGYFGGRALFGAKTETRYVLAAAEKNTVITTVSGSGQVSASNQVELKAKVSGDVYKVAAKSGQTVKAGDLLVALTAEDAIKSVRDAEISLESAKLQLKKLEEPADQLTLLQAKNSLAQAQESKQTTEDNINKAYEDSFNTIANAFLDLPTIITSLYDITYGNGIGKSEASIGAYQDNMSALYNTAALEARGKISSLEDTVQSDYKTARAKYDRAFSNYKSANRYSNHETIAALLNETQETVKAIAQAVKSENNLLDAWADSRTQIGGSIFSKVEEYQNTISGDISKTNSHLSSLTSQISTLSTYANSLLNAERTIAEKTQSLADLEAGTDADDIRAQQIAVEQKANALADAQEKLADYYIRAPFDGIIAAVDVKQGETVSSGATLATIITQQKIVGISLNEVDAAKVKVGQKATLTFDAIEDLEITGQVVNVDIIGTVSSGVVSYNVEIALDTQDDRIKPGMSVSATIITDSKVDVLTIPNTAVKGQSGDYYVLVLSDYTSSSAGVAANGVTSKTPPTRQIITIGLADDTNTEIISGLGEGDLIVAKTTTVTASSGNSSAPSLLQSLMPGRRTTNSNQSTTKSSSNSSNNSSKSSSGSSAGGSVPFGAPPGM